MLASDDVRQSVTSGDLGSVFASCITRILLDKSRCLCKRGGGGDACIDSSFSFFLLIIDTWATELSYGMPGHNILSYFNNKIICCPFSSFTTIFNNANRLQKHKWAINPIKLCFDVAYL